MTHQNGCELTPELMEELVTNGVKGFPEVFRALLYTAMQVERTKHIQDKEYKRSEERKGHANVYKPKSVKIRIGEITFDIQKYRRCGQRINKNPL